MESVTRSLKVFLAISGFTAAAAVAPTSTLAAEEEPQAEILHWWFTEGEAAALDILVNAFEARGGHVYDSTKTDQEANREEAIERMSKGYPPTLTQWNAGRDVVEFYEFGLIDSISDPALIEKLQRSVPETVLSSITFNDQIIAIPTNIHSENWMWYSNTLLSYTDSMLSGDWSQLTALGASLKKKGIPLLAVGDQSWQVRILFTSLFLGVSREAYRDFYLSTDDKSVDHEGFAQTLKLFNQLAKYSQSFGDGNWNTQVKAVSENRAGATFMGDWAKAEFNALGQSAGKEFGCALSGGSTPGLLLVIDAFILGKVTDVREKQGQALMLDLVSDPELNLQFNTLKGSVSPYVVPPADQLDACSAQVYRLLSDNEAVIPPYASYPHGQYMHMIDNTIYEFWRASIENDSDETLDETLIAETINTFRDILKQRKTDSATLGRAN